MGVELENVEGCDEEWCNDCARKSLEVSEEYMAIDICINKLWSTVCAFESASSLLTGAEVFLGTKATDLTHRSTLCCQWRDCCCQQIIIGCRWASPSINETASS